MKIKLQILVKCIPGTYLDVLFLPTVGLTLRDEEETRITALTLYWLIFGFRVLVITTPES